MTTADHTERPRVRFSLRWKITLPFMLLALALALGATYLVGTFLTTSAQERFLRQLADSGQQATDALVRVERDLLSEERLVANTQGVVETLISKDAEGMRDRVLPLAVSAGADLVVILDEQGVSLLTIRQRPDGTRGQYETIRNEAFYAGWESVQALLAGGTDEKRAGLEILNPGQEGETAVFWVGGPIIGSGDRVLGVVLVGDYLEGMVEELRTQAGANVSIYDRSGAILASTLNTDSPQSLTVPPDALDILAGGDPEQSPVRRVEIGEVPYGEVLTPLLARNGLDNLGVLGLSLLETPLASTGEGGPDLTTVVLLSALALLMVVIVGLLISNSITRPLVRMADASTAVATGNLDTRLPEGGTDEIGVLAGTFNRMVEGLQEGLVYHDLLGRAVTPEVREELRRSLADGARAASVQSARATVLVAGLRGVSAENSNADPAKTMESLSEYFAALVPLVANHGGVVYRFDGDVAVALFGLFPKPSPAPVGALQATHAAFELIELVARLNLRRQEAGLARLPFGVGVATGQVVAGGLGTRDRVQYTIIGDGVDTALQVERVLRDTDAEGLMISGETYHALGGARGHFDFGRRGQAQIAGRRAPLEIHEVVGRGRRLLEAGGAGFFDDTTAPLN